jgi:hypothetical protein
VACEEFEAHGSRHEGQARHVLPSCEQLPTVNERSTVEAGNRVALFLWLLIFPRDCIALGGNYETLSARSASGAFSNVLIVECDHCIATRTVELNRHVIAPIESSRIIYQEK